MNISLINFLMISAIILLVLYSFYRNYRKNESKRINPDTRSVWRLTLLP